MELVPQVGSRECGLSVIAMLAEHYHHDTISVDALRVHANFGVHGLSVAELVRLGLTQDVLLEAYEGSLAEIAALAKRSWVVIALRSDLVSHYVLVRFHRHAQVEVYDPAAGVSWTTRAALAARYANVALTSVGLPRAAAHRSWTRPEPQRVQLVTPRLVAITLMLSVPLVALMLLSGALMKVIFDVALPYALPGLLLLLGLGFGLAIIARLLVTVSKNYLMQHAQEQAAHRLYGLVVARLGPAELVHREKLAFDDYLQRLSLVPIVSSYQAERLVVLGHDLLLIATSAAVLMYVAPPLLAVLAVFAALTGGVTYLAFIFHRPLLARTQVTTSDFYAALVDLARASIAPSSARQFGPASTRFLRARRRLAQSERKLATGRVSQASIVSGLELLAPLVLTLLASERVLANALSPGALLLFLSTSQLFLMPLHSLVQWSIKASEQRQFRPLVQTLLDLPPAPGAASKVTSVIAEIYVRELILQRDRPLKVLTGATFTGNMRLVGANGSGKTTLLRTLSGDYAMPGEIFINQVAHGAATRPLLQARSLYLGEMLALPGHDLLMSCIAPTSAHRAQLARFDEAALTHLLNSVGLSWQTPLSHNGLALSSGQKQVVQLLRLFTETYDVLLLDEALQHIDPAVLAQLRKLLAPHWPPLLIEVSHSQTYLAATGRTYAL